MEAAGLGIVAHQFTCPSGLYFNKAADSCDYSRNVHCSKASTTTSTTTTTEEPITTTRAAAVAVTSRTNPIYKSPSRTTQRTTTEEPITELPELDQEDPKVIKELIDLIKKAGGIEELEKQLNLHEDGAPVVSSKNDPKATTPSSISKSLYDKIKNRASVFKTRPNFNGASQPERVLDRSETTEKLVTSTSTVISEASVPSKKYSTVNRFSRPNPQNAGIENLPESDAVLIEKPQYTSIQRRPVVKPAVVAENDYNSDIENSREESVEPPAQRQKYASINRGRPQVKVDKEDESEEDEEEIRTPVTQSTTTKPTSRYVNLSRRRSTTPSTDIER